MTRRVVNLTPCDDREYAEFVALQIVEYARQLTLAGETSPERSVAIARDRLQDLRADRLRDSGHIFLIARSQHSTLRLGWVWLSPAPDFLGPGHQCSRWLSQLTVEGSCRGQGWGYVAARRLYESHGYELVNQFSTDAHLRKRLERSGPRS